MLYLMKPSLCRGSFNAGVATVSIKSSRGETNTNRTALTIFPLFSLTHHVCRVILCEGGWVEWFTVYGSCEQLRERLHASRSWRPWIDFGWIGFEFLCASQRGNSKPIHPTTTNFATVTRLANSIRQQFNPNNHRRPSRWPIPYLSTQNMLQPSTGGMM